MCSTASPPPPRSGSGAPSPRPPRPRRAPGRRSLGPPRARRGPHRLRQDAGGVPVRPSTGWPATPPPAERRKRCRVLYVSPLKALAVDVERNLRAPLVGIRQAATRLGLPAPDVTVAVRSGDTPAAGAPAFARAPRDVLITTPESLFLMLTSQAREALRRGGDGHPRRGARGGRHQARRPPGPQPRAARRPARAAGAAHRALRHRRAGRGGGALPRGRATGRGREAALDQGVGPRRRRAHPGHVRARGGHR